MDEPCYASCPWVFRTPDGSVDERLTGQVTDPASSPDGR